MLNFVSSNHVEQLLEKQDLTLQEILDQDCYQQEKINNFYSKHLGELIDYVINCDVLETNYKLALKFPFISSEILALRVHLLLTSDQYLDQIFSLLEQDTIEPTTLGYFSKVVQALVTQSPQEFWDYLVKRQRIKTNLIKHIENDGISQIVYCIIILQTTINNLYQLEERLSFFRTLVEEFLRSQNQSLTDIFILVLDWVQDENNVQNQKSHFINILYETENLEFFTSETKNNLSISSQLINRFLILEQKSQKWNNMHDLVQGKIFDLGKILFENNQSEELEQSFGSKQQIFGFNRLNLVITLEILSRNINDRFLEQQIQADIFYKLLVNIEFNLHIILKELMNIYKWNNQLHIQIMKIFQNSLRNSKFPQYLIQNKMILSLLQKLQMNVRLGKTQIDYIVGYRGHLTVILSELSEIIGKSIELKGLQEQENEGWDLLFLVYDELNKRNSSLLLDIDPERRQYGSISSIEEYTDN